MFCTSRLSSKLQPSNLFFSSIQDAIFRNTDYFQRIEIDNRPITLPLQRSTLHYQKHTDMKYVKRCTLVRFPEFSILPKSTSQHFWQKIENEGCFIHLFCINCQISSQIQSQSSYFVKKSNVTMANFEALVPLVTNSLSGNTCI